MSAQMSRIPSFPSLRAPLAAAVAAALLLPGAALADGMDATVTHLTTQQIVVESNGVSYHSVSPFANLVADVRVQVDTDVFGHVKSWKAGLGLATEDLNGISFDSYAKSKTYPWYDRPRSVDRVETFVVPSVVWGDYVKDRCNALADHLRAQGLGNTAIFAKNRKLKLAVRPWIDADTTGAGSGHIFQEADSFENLKKVEVVCKKWSGAAIPQASNNLTIGPAHVVAKGLSIVERSGLSGVCKIRLDGWITTDRPNVEVSFRYRNQEGKQSQVWTVNTGESKTATFSHWYNVKNNPDFAETGSVRMVGVSHDFQSGWAHYAMHCTDPGATGFAAKLPPTLKMTIVEQGKVMVQGRICPQKLKLVGVLEGHGNYSGHALFFGPGYLSPLHDYHVTNGQKVLIGADVPLDWSVLLAGLNGTLPVQQVRSFTFNATDEDNTVVASLKNQQYHVVCEKPKLNPAVQSGAGGLTVEPRQPAAPAQRRLTTPKAVQLKPLVPGTVPQRVLPQRMQQKRN